jgi:two-component system cell cycle response regulator DivK
MSTETIILKGKRIFIIDDNPGNLAIMRITLEKAGAICGIERWGAQTIQRLTDFAPVDVILLDLMLAYGKSGYDIYDEIKGLPALASIPTVLVTASDPGIELPKAQAKGFAGFISKPVRMHTLPTYIIRILGGEPVWAPLG